MKKTSETIVFFGSGPVAKASLSFITQHFNIEAVITKPATKVEMMQIVPGVQVFAAANKQELNEVIKTQPFKSKVGVIVDFGIIVDQQVIDYFPLGIVNSHFSLLPEWRGADPITFAILSGQEKTGVSLMLIVEALDEGALLAQSELNIPAEATTPELTKLLVELSNKMLEAVLPVYMEGEIRPHEQPADRKASYSRKLTKDDGIIDWHKPAEQIEREIRAYLDWPKSRTILADKEVIITKAAVVDERGEPGQIKVSRKNIIVHCGDKSLNILKLKPVGKSEMSAEAYLAGNKFRT